MSIEIVKKHFIEITKIPGFYEQLRCIINRYLEFSKLSIDPESIFCSTDELVYFKDGKLDRFSRSTGPQAPAIKINCEFPGYNFTIELCYKEGFLHADNGYAVYVPGTEFGEYWKNCERTYKYTFSLLSFQMK